MYRGSRDSTPDGVYKSPSGKLIAFEYEIAQKSKRRYQDKIRRYVDCVRNTSDDDRPKYDHIRIICEKKSVWNVLQKGTALYSDYFTIEMADDFFGRFKEFSPSSTSIAGSQSILL
ncbi:MAG: hypothetical protein AB7O96_07570 [Pseudobdellovibrionaceae bacterium]